MTSYLKTMLSGLRQWITAQKADWSQNDETAANFIKGRPCYEDDSGTVVPLPYKYLPTIPAEKLPEIPAEKLQDSVYTAVQKTFEGSFDKVTEGRDTFVYNGINYYKFSEFAPKREDVTSFSGTSAAGYDASYIENGENCCEYGKFITVYQAGQCTVESTNFDAPSAGLYAVYQSGNDFLTAGTYNFTLRLVRNIIQSSTTFKRYYLDVDESGALTATEVTE